MELEDKKQCRLCGEYKLLSNFVFRNDSQRYRSECRQCNNERTRNWRLNNLEHCRELSRKYREQHKDELNLYSKRYQSSHLEKFREYNKRYRDNMSPEQKLKQRIRDKRYVESARNNPVYLEKRRQWSRESARRTCKHHTRYEQLRKQYDAEFKLKKQIRNSIRQAFKRRVSDKSCHTEEIIGCSVQELYQHLCNTFEKRYGIEYSGQDVHIDHIIPLSLAETTEEIISLNHWSNLQLLTPQDNLSKSDHDLSTLSAHTPTCLIQY